eukprot:403330866
MEEGVKLDSADILPSNLNKNRRQILSGNPRARQLGINVQTPMNLLHSITNPSDCIDYDQQPPANQFNLFTHQKIPKHLRVENVYNLKQALLELYLSVKIRSDDEIDNYNEEMYAVEKQEMMAVDGFTLVDYVKSSIEILMNMKMDDNGGGDGAAGMGGFHDEEDYSDRSPSDITIKKPNLQMFKKQNPPKNANSKEKEPNKPIPKIDDKTPTSSILDLQRKLDQISSPHSYISSILSIPMAHREYEKALRQLELECRNHIKVEQQMKLHIDALQDKLQISRKECDRLNNVIIDKVQEHSEQMQKFNDLIKRQDDEMLAKIEKIQQLDIKFNKEKEEKESAVEKVKDLQKFNEKLKKENMQIKRSLQLQKEQMQLVKDSSLIAEEGLTSNIQDKTLISGRNIPEVMADYADMNTQDLLQHQQQVITKSQNVVRQFAEMKNIHFNNVNHINNNSFILNTSRDSLNTKAVANNKKLSVSIMEFTKEPLTERNNSNSSGHNAHNTTTTAVGGVGNPYNFEHSNQQSNFHSRMSSNKFATNNFNTNNNKSISSSFHLNPNASMLDTTNNQYTYRGDEITQDDNSNNDLHKRSRSLSQMKQLNKSINVAKRNNQIFSHNFVPSTSHNSHVTSEHQQHSGFKSNKNQQLSNEILQLKKQHKLRQANFSKVGLKNQTVLDAHISTHHHASATHRSMSNKQTKNQLNSHRNNDSNLPSYSNAISYQHQNNLGNDTSRLIVGGGVNMETSRTELSQLYNNTQNTHRRFVNNNTNHQNSQSLSQAPVQQNNLFLSSQHLGSQGTVDMTTNKKSTELFSSGINISTDYASSQTARRQHNPQRNSNSNQTVIIQSNQDIGRNGNNNFTNAQNLNLNNDSWAYISLQEIKASRYWI